MKRRYRLLVVVLSVVLISLVGAGTVLAYTTFNDNTLSGGVGDYGASPRYYYITDSASDYSACINGAVWCWNNTDLTVGVATPVCWVRTYTQSSSVMDIYHHYYYETWTGLIASTRHILDGEVISPYLADWSWGMVKLNSPLFDPLTSFDQKGTVSHEIGHIMGLGHTSVTDRVMCKLGDGRTVNKAQLNDCYGINYLY